MILGFHTYDDAELFLSSIINHCGLGNSNGISQKQTCKADALPVIRLIMKSTPTVFRSKNIGERHVTEGNPLVM